MITKRSVPSAAREKGCSKQIQETKAAGYLPLIDIPRARRQPKNHHRSE